MKKLKTKPKSPLILYGKTSNNRFYNPFHTLPTSHTSTLFSVLNYQLSPAYIKTKNSIVVTGHKIYEDFNYVYFKENYRCKKKLIGKDVSVYRVVNGCEAVPYVPMKDEIGYVYTGEEMERDKFLARANDSEPEYVVDGVKVIIKRINFGRIESVRFVVDGWMRGYVQVGKIIDDGHEYEVIKECSIDVENAENHKNRSSTAVHSSANALYRYKYVVHREGVSGVFLSNRKYRLNDKLRLRVHRFDDGRYLFKEDDSVDLSVGWNDECANETAHVPDVAHGSLPCQVPASSENDKLPDTSLPDMTVQNLREMDLPAFRKKLNKYKRNLLELKDIFTGQKNIEVYKQIFLMLKTRRSYIEYIKRDNSAFLEYPKYYHVGIAVLEGYDRWFEKIKRTKKVWMAYLKRSGDVNVERCLGEMKGKEREFFVGYFRSIGLLSGE